MEKVRVIADPPVGNEDEAGKPHVIYVLFQCCAQGEVIQGVAGEGFNGDGKAAVVHKEAHLDDGEFAFLLADAHLTQPFFQDISFLIQDVLIRLFDLEIEVGDIVVNDFRGPSGFPDEVRVDPPDDPVLVVIDEIQRVIDVVRVVFPKNRFTVILVLTDSGTFGSRVQEPAKDEEFGKAVNVKLNLRKVLIRREKSIQPQFWW